MKLAEITVKGVTISAEVLHPITSGMIGATVGFAFDEKWEALDKIVVFRAGKVAKDVTGVTDWSAVEVPHEVLKTPGVYLNVGVYGYNTDKTLAIPSLEVDVSFIRTGTDPENDPAADPSLPIYAQLQAQIDDLKRNGVPGETETQMKAVLYTAQILTKEQKAQVRENIGILQADLNQNDETKPDFVKNRLAWTEPEELGDVIVDSLTINCVERTSGLSDKASSLAMVQGDEYTVDFFEPGQYYRVTIDGNHYDVESQSYSNLPYLGSIYYTDTAAPLPFWIYAIVDMTPYLYVWLPLSEAGFHTISIQKISPEVVHQIDPKYYDNLSYTEKSILTYDGNYTGKEMFTVPGSDWSTPYVRIGDYIDPKTITGFTGFFEGDEDTVPIDEVEVAQRGGSFSVGNSGGFYIYCIYSNNNEFNVSTGTYVLDFNPSGVEMFINRIEYEATKIDPKYYERLGYTETSVMTYDGNSEGKETFYVLLEGADYPIPFVRIGDYIDPKTITSGIMVQNGEEIQSPMDKVAIEQGEGLFTVGFDGANFVYCIYADDNEFNVSTGTYVLSIGTLAWVSRIEYETVHQIDSKYIPPVDSLLFNGDDGKQYEVSIKNGALSVVVKGSDAGGDFNVIKIGAPGDYAGASTLDTMFGYGMYYKISDRILTQKELENCTLYFEHDLVSKGLRPFEDSLDFFYDEAMSNMYGASIRNSYPVIFVLNSGNQYIEAGTYFGFDAAVESWNSMYGPPNCNVFVSGEIRLA